ncbi:Sua5/YciO/YrdC/YwlC family protein [Methanoregula boonei 6A8]|jgi:L-threonylcarbamoyladenylate synthase|uniref:L-threonylcarbamoyladenylate synthase n=1 Tax=Methanoregula boonei (strain DSM 21154 / JCM 14090 / 6A8) TaxID=456442 RepID=A7I9S8_METB6|nr:L-threonylcarbamoyladenylate synthase [Methanoregula boonei]ABS56489.1 Sua5/YciO/YrdC/YwlC family protein [Methanoregula boonei 6A8]
MDIIERAVSVLTHDGLIVYPTDTLYGLGADAFSDEALEKVYEAKKRDLSKPISIAVSDFEMLAAVSHTTPFAEEFIERFLPGPVTVIVPVRKMLPEILSGGTGMIGIRIPAHGVALQIIEKFDAPITATSANLSGGKDPQTPEECTVPRDLFVDGGRLAGKPSTVVDLTKKEIVRRGAEADAIEAFLRSG